MVYTSYFASKKFEPKDGVSIARYAKFWTGMTCPALYPSVKLLKDYKDGIITEEEYKERYYSETLSKLDPKLMAEQLEGKVLLCYEKSEDFCHRHLVAEWFRANDIMCEELC
jgi:uncharacterized protein (DUF488 family)